MQIFDSHAHYNDEKFEMDREETIKKVYEAGVKKLICAGYSLDSSIEAVKIANEHDNIYAQLVFLQMIYLYLKTRMWM